MSKTFQEFFVKKNWKKTLEPLQSHGIVAYWILFWSTSALCFLNPSVSDFLAHNFS